MTIKQDTRIHRTTMFKVPDAENQRKLMEAYQTLSKTQVKGDQPYILYVCAGLAADEPLSKGYTVVAHTMFKNVEDMRYFDNECAAHAAVKKTAASLGMTEPPLAVYFEGQPALSK
ncbi:hypothetical protein B0H63DRAFT_5414 [Podospora didyma]|uniref:Stress-response A/B barrel domain-containing protein n=1 Tax=Podospora didyma TaxID=330526 RepID=A0AAE0P482_9PEZI|nr:hypothetical protein B0H63DRAFT_5414 [Podospora didyma]